MTLPVRLPPPKDPYNRPARELAGYVAQSVEDGGEVLPPGLAGPSESITLYAAPAGRGLLLREQPIAITDYFATNTVKFDASAYDAARLVVNVHRAGASGARARLFYSLTGQEGSFIDAGIDLSGATAPLVCRIDTPGTRDGSRAIAVAARADVYWRAMWDLGDGVISPIIGGVFLQFMVKTFKDCVWTTVVPPEDMLASGESVATDPRWTLSGNTGAFDTSCVAPGCIARLVTWRFGSGAPVNAEATRVFDAGSFPDFTPGRFARLRGELSWNYLFRTCPDLNKQIRLTVSVNGVVMTTVPSGFPPYDFNWLPFELIVPADGTGVTLGIGIYGDNGVCSVSLIGGIRNLELAVLAEGSNPSDCVPEEDEEEETLPTDTWDWDPTEGSGTTITDKNGSGVDLTINASVGPYAPGTPQWTADGVRYDHHGIFAFAFASVSNAALTMERSSVLMYVKMPPVWTAGGWLGGHRGSLNEFDRKITIDLGTGKLSAHVEQFAFPFGLQTVTSASMFGAGDEFVVAYTHDGTTLRLYINGIEEDSIACSDAALSGSPSFHVAGGGPAFSDKEPPSAGGIFSSAGATIDRVVAANRALTAAEVLAYYEAIKLEHPGLP